MRQRELTSLIGLRDSGGDRLVLVRLERADGTRGYVLRVGAGSVMLTAGDLARLSRVIHVELVSVNQIRILAQMIGLLLMCALVWFLASGINGPLFAYPWSN